MLNVIGRGRLRYRCLDGDLRKQLNVTGYWEYKDEMHTQKQVESFVSVVNSGLIVKTISRRGLGGCKKSSYKKSWLSHNLMLEASHLRLLLIGSKFSR